MTAFFARFHFFFITLSLVKIYFQESYATGCLQNDVTDKIMIKNYTKQTLLILKLTCTQE